MAVNESALELGEGLQVAVPSTSSVNGAVLRPVYGTVQGDGTVALNVNANITGGASNTVAATNAGTSATTANPIQGVTNGVPVPVSGTVTATDPLATNAGASATQASPIQGVTGGVPVPISGTVSPATLPATTGTISANGQSVVVAMNGATAVRISVTGVFVGTINAYTSPDAGTTLTASTVGAGSATSVSGTTSATVAVSVPYFVMKSTSWTSGSATVTLTPIFQPNVLLVGPNGQSIQVAYQNADGQTWTNSLMTAGTAYGFNRARSLADRVTVSDVGTDPGTGTKGALLVQGSAAGIPIPISGSTGSTTTPNVTQFVDGTTPTQKAAVSAAGALKVDNSGVTQPVSGTVTANVQGGNATAVKVDGSAVTQPVSGTVSISGTPSVSVSNFPATQAISATALPLPTGAATAANQPAINGDGGALAHITNFPATQTVSGTVGISGSVAVTGTFWQATQPVSLASLPALAAGSALIGATNLYIGGNANSASNPVYIAPSQVTKTDRSGTITTGGTAQPLMIGNASRRGWMIQNNSTGDLWFNEINGTATLSQPSFKLAPGQYYESSDTSVGTAAISIIGATTGQTFTAREW